MVKNLHANSGDTGDVSLIPGLGRCLGGRNGNLLQYSCLGSPTERGAWWATVHGVAESWVRLSDGEHTSKSGASWILGLLWEISEY